MRVRNLETFYWIAKLGSFRAAAEHIHLTQPAITARIQVLEHDLGAEVFVRETRSAELTQAGRRLLPYAEKLMDIDQAVMTAFSETTTVKQTIRLGASETIVATWLPDFLSAFSKQHPNLNFDLTVDATNNLRNALVAREIDLAFLMGPVAEASTENLELCAFEMIFAAQKEYSGRHQLWTKEKLSNEPILTFSSNTRPYRNLKETLAPFSDGDVKITGSASLGAILRLAHSGYGICAIPRETARHELTSGDLVELKTDFQLPPIGFTASLVSDGPISSLCNEISTRAAEFVAADLINNIYQKPKNISI